MTKRLIEEWLPIAELGLESVRERTPMTPFPAPNRLHVWWARRPLVASRAAVLASLLPADADRKTFMHMLGIHGDPLASRKRIDAAKRKGERFEGEAYTYKRAFTYKPSEKEEFLLLEQIQKLGIEKPKDVVGVLAEKKASDLLLWDSSTRATKGKLGAPDGTKSWIDAIHHCAHRARSIGLNAAKQLLDDNGLASSPISLTALEAVLEVLPLSARYTGFDPVKAAQPAASDFEALENLRRLALSEQVAAPKQLELVLAELADVD